MYPPAIDLGVRRQGWPEVTGAVLRAGIGGRLSNSVDVALQNHSEPIQRPDYTTGVRNKREVQRPGFAPAKAQRRKETSTPVAGVLLCAFATLRSILVEIRPGRPQLDIDKAPSYDERL